MAWYLAPALAKLRDQINARWPARDRTSDGTIGDAAHSSTVSDHNPDATSSPPGMVRAIDIDEDGIDTAAVILALINDQRTRYVIYEARIWTRDTLRWATYTGPNLHRHHIHVSVRNHSGHDTDDRPWAIPVLEEPRMELTDAQIDRIADKSAERTWGKMLTHRERTASAVVWLVDGRLAAGDAADAARAAVAAVSGLDLTLEVDEAELAAAWAAAVPDDLAGRVVDELRARLES